MQRPTGSVSVELPTRWGRASRGGVEWAAWTSGRAADSAEAGEGVAAPWPSAAGGSTEWWVRLPWLGGTVSWQISQRKGES